MLMAYADGELDLVARAEIEAAIAADPEVARSVERHRALRARVQAAYSGVLDEPVPTQLASLVTPPISAPVVDLATRRVERAAPSPAAPKRWVLSQRSAMAAALALGAFIGVLLLRGPAALYEESESGLVARGDLARALTWQLAGDPGAGAVRIGMSFRDRSGAYCRTFRLQHEAPLAGLACRSGEDWRLQVLAAAVPEGGELRGAAAMPMVVLQAVDITIDGEPLDAADETAARDAGWRTVPKSTGEK
jgi:hypothetical protein